LTIGDKVRLVDRARHEFGLPRALAAAELARSTWYHRQHQVAYAQKHAELKGPLLAIAETFPEYGYRRAADELSERLGIQVNSKVMQRLNGLWGLAMLSKRPQPKPSAIRRTIAAVGNRANLVQALDEIGPFEVLYTDFTELIYQSGRAWLMPIIDHHTKLWLSWALGAAVTDLALEAWDDAKTMLNRLGAPCEGLIMHHDRDPVYTSHDWVKQLLVKDGVRLSYALHGAKDNPEMESFNSRFKCENRSLIADAGSLEDLRALVAERHVRYNQRRKHSTLENQSPWVYIQGLKLKR